jgi:hypothetical protein
MTAAHVLYKPLSKYPAVMPSVGSASKLTLSQRLQLSLLFIFLFSEVMTGPLRYLLSMANLSALVYVPKILLAATVLGVTLYRIYVGRISTAFAVTLLIFALSSLVGWIYTGNLMQPAFGIYALIPLLYAVMAEPALRKAGTRILPYVVVLWCLAALGVAIDYYTDVPWAGLEYKFGDVSVEGSREWTTFGFERVAGFARASFEAADQLLLLSIVIVFLSERKLLKPIVWIATGILIYWTTTKKTSGTWIILTLVLPWMTARFTPAVIIRQAAWVIPTLAALIGIALPVSTLFITYQLGLNDFVSQVLFASFDERLTYVWPASLDLALTHGSPIFGRGIGGIGTAQKYFEESLQMPGDNFFVYVYVIFGVFSLPLILFYTKRVATGFLKKHDYAALMWTLSISVLFNGWATNVLESPITSIVLGASISYLSCTRRSAI